MVNTKKYTIAEVDAIIETFEFVVTTCNNEPKRGFDTLQLSQEEEGDYVAEFVGNETDGFAFVFYTNEQNFVWQNGNLGNAIPDLVEMMHDVESDTNKLAVSREFDENLEVPYAIDVEDKSFFYNTKEERDIDYAELVKIFTDESTEYLYFLD